MDKVFEPTSSFEFSKLSLGHPQTTKGGTYFTKLLFDNQSLYVQFPKCKTKQGIIQNEKNIYSDLVYETTYNNELTEWLEHLETICQKLLYEKNNLWFSGDIELSDIESAFTNVAKMYKSGKQFIIRCYIPKPQMIKYSVPCFVYDENENPLTLNDIDITKEIIPLIKVEGIKFTNKSFQLEFNLSQIMVMNSQEELKHCLIKPSIRTPNQSQVNIPLQTNLENTNSKSENTTSEIINHISFNDNNKSHNTIEEYIINDNELEVIDDKTLAQPKSVIHKGGNDNTEDEEEDDEEDDEDDDSENEETDDEYVTEDDDNNDDEIEDNEEQINEKYETQNLDNSTNNQIKDYGLKEINDLEILNEQPQQNKNELKSKITTHEPTSSYLEKNVSNSLDQIKKNEHLELVDLNIDNNITDSIKLRKPNEVYYEIYKAAREKAKRAKKLATEAYLEAKNIKIKYMLDDLDESDEDERQSDNY